MAGKQRAGVEGAPTGILDRCRFTVPDSNAWQDTLCAVRAGRREEMVTSKE
jgi:hypothetical protein